VAFPRRACTVENAKREVITLQKEGSGRAAKRSLPSLFLFSNISEPFMTALMHDRSSASAAIRRAMEAFELVRDRKPAEVAQARGALTRHIEQLVASGQTDEERLAVAGLIYLKSLPGIEPAWASPEP
jgi:hypothetical protein